MSSTESVHDIYCWHCCGTDTSLKCSNCVRSFHIKCEVQNEIDNTEGNRWICSVCTMLNDSQLIDLREDRETMPTVINRVYKGKTFKVLNHISETVDGAVSDGAGPIVNPIDLTKIKQKAETYNSFYELYVDVHWIFRNCVIQFSEHHEKTMAARALLDLIDGEIASIKKCAECYSRAVRRPKGWFSMLCTQPHLIVWAKLVGFTYWPAKVMSVDQLVNVRFFGDHTYADIPASSCYLYTEKSPKAPKVNTDQYNVALKEAKLYIKNICKKYGSFEFAQQKSTLDPNLLKNYIEQMIPGIVDYQASKEVLEAEMLENPNKGQTYNDSSTEDTTEEVPEVETNKSDGLMEKCKDLVICLQRVEIQLEDLESDEAIGEEQSDEMQSEDVNNPRQDKTTEQLSDEPPQKRVRFCDEFGEDLEYVKIIERTEDEPESEEFIIELSESEEYFADLPALTEDDLISPIAVEQLDHVQDVDNQNHSPSIETESDVQSTANQDDSHDTGSQDDAQTAEVPVEYVDLNFYTDVEQKAYEKVMQKMKSAQGELLNFMHLSQIRSEALNCHFSKSKVKYSKEVDGLQAQIKILIAQLQTAVSKRDEILSERDQLKESVVAIKEEHSREVATIKAENQAFEKQLAEMKISIEKVREEKVNSEHRLNQKYLEIIENMRKDADHKLSEQSRCKGCGKNLAYCTPICEQMWNAWQKPKMDGNGDQIKK